MIITILNLLVFLLIIGVLIWMQKKYFSFSKRVFTATGIGVLYGIFLQVLYSKEQILQTLEWTSIVGEGYIRLLQMIVIPLIFISILSAIINLKKGGDGLGKMTGLILGVLIGTAVIAAGVGIVTANGFGLSVEGLQMGASETTQGAVMESKLTNMETQSAADRLVSLIPTNVFLDFTGSRPTSTIGIVIFTAFLGIAALGMKRKKPASFDFFKNLVVSLHDVVMRLVTLVLRLTPYGILALMAKVVATSSLKEIMNLGMFVLASYVALISMFIIHLILISFVRVNPFTYVKKVLPVLTFAFTSRSSAGTIPLNVETQIDKLGVDEGNANLSASL
ncbi:MAG: cation:dicarboxylase symporter family transporter, partial [Bacteroidales bacterium]